MNMPEFLRQFLTSSRSDSSYASGCILVASDTLPLADQESGGLRMTTIIRALASFGFPLVFASFRDVPDLPGSLRDPDSRRSYEQKLLELGVNQIIYGVKQVKIFLKKRGSVVKIAFIAFPHVAQSLMHLVRLYSPRAILAYDMVDFHALRIKREGDLLNLPSKILESEKMEIVEMDIFRSCDVVFAVSEPEKAAVLERVPAAKVYVVSNGFPVRAMKPPGPTDRQNIAFIGGFWHTPNIDAVEWFVANVWPIILDQNNKVKFNVAGSNMSDREYALRAHLGVNVLGFVADLDMFFDTNRVFVAPLRFGAGVKGKVGQSMAYGLPVVTTCIGAEGMNVNNGQELIICEPLDPQSMASAILRLLSDDEQWTYLQQKALLYISREHSPELIRAVLLHALTEVTIPAISC